MNRQVEVAHFESLQEAGDRVQGELIDMITRYEDYREVDGVLIPHVKRVELDFGSVQAHGAKQRMVIRTIELNAPIDDALFEMPGGAGAGP